MLTSATDSTALSNNTAVATFSDTDTLDMAGDFTATIDWGDGVTTTGTVVGSNGSFTVDGGHTYADEGSDAASVALTHNPDGAHATQPVFALRATTWQRSACFAAIGHAGLPSRSWRKQVKEARQGSNP